MHVGTEAVRVAERVLDHQLASLAAERTDLERLMRLGIASLAGSLAGAGLLVQGGAVIALPATVVLATGVVVLAVATGAAMIVPAPSEATVGPSVGDVCLLEQRGRGRRGARIRAPGSGRARRAAQRGQPATRGKAPAAGHRGSVLGRRPRPPDRGPPRAWTTSSAARSASNGQPRKNPLSALISLISLGSTSRSMAR